MFSFFFFSASCEDWDYCRAPAKHAEPVPNKNIRYAQVIIRHGQRSPIAHVLDKDFVGEWNCDGDSALTPRSQSAPQTRYRFYNHKIRESSIDYPPSCQAGELTIAGQTMHEELGSFYRSYYFNDLKFLPEKYDLRVIGFQSSPIDRCLRSGSSFMLGLYPPLDPNEVINLETGTSTLHPLIFNEAHCTTLAEGYKRFLASPEVAEFVQRCLSNEKLVQILDDTQLSHDYSGIQKLSEWGLAFNCTSNPPPAWLTDEIMEIIREAGRYDQIKRCQIIGPNISASYLVNYMMNLADYDIGQPNGRKFELLSSHDTSLTSLLVFLGHQFEEPCVPRYRSHIAMEYWEEPTNKELYVRFVYNGEEVKLPDFNNQTLIPLNDFRIWQKAKTQDYCPL